MKVRYLTLAVLVLAALVTASIVSAEWTYELSYYVPYTDYGIDTAVMVGSEILVGASNTSTQEDAAVFVLDTDLNAVASYNITSQADVIRALDAKGDLIAVGAEYGNATVFVINRTDASVLGPVTIESEGGLGYSATVEKIAFSGDYVFALVLDDYDLSYYLYILNKTPSVVSSEPVGAMADIARVENSDYLLYWNGSSYIYIVNGTNGTLDIVDSINVTGMIYGFAGYYNSSENSIYAVYGTDTGVFLAKYTIGTGLDYNIKISNETSLTPVYVAPTVDGLYIVTSDGYGYRVKNTTSPIVEIEAIPVGAFGYYYGSEYIYALQDGEIRRYMLEIEYVTTTTTETVTETYTPAVTVYDTVTTTATKTVTETETQVVYIYTAPKTETVTTTVQGPYTETDLLFAGIITFLLGLAAAYLLRRR